MYPQALEAKDVSKAMILALALNDYALLRKVYEQVPNVGWEGEILRGVGWWRVRVLVS